MIINPIWFYIISVSEIVKYTSITGAVLFVAFTVIWCIGLGDDYFNHGNSNDRLHFKERNAKEIKILKWLIVGVVINGILAVFIPDKTTCYQMLIASQVTVENVNNITDVVKNCVDYIVNALK